MIDFLIRDILDEIVQDEGVYNSIVSLLNPNGAGLQTLAQKEAAKDFFTSGKISPSDPSPVHPYLDGQGYIILSPVGTSTYAWSDEMLRIATDSCISYAMTGVEDATIDEDSFQLEAFFSAFNIPFTGDNSYSQVSELQIAREIMFSNEYIYLNNDSIVIYAKYYLLRLTSWFNSVQQDLDPEAEDETAAYETAQQGNLDSEVNQDYAEGPIDSALAAFLSAAIGDGAGISSLRTIAFENRQSYDLDNTRFSSFGNVFSRINADLSSISSDEATASALLEKLQATGLLELASYTFEISEFAKRRLRSKDSLISNVNDSANGIVDANVDIPWMMKLAEVRQNLQADPIFFSQVIYYFPGLTTMFLDAIAVIVDYSNNGLGGEYEEENREIFIETLKDAFGNGTSDIQLASEFRNTQQRIEDAIIGYRENTAPLTPDIFHLRLGAANFYVPPVSIDVNTRFKTGSLVGGALRQKNSPKFNTGYKETIVNLRLFFPNYQEIWGMSDPGGNIDLSTGFEINFTKSEDKVIDKFLSSLRGLVAAFKYSPVLPVKNHYLNSVHGITGVCLSSMSISTVPGFPFALAVDLQLLNFNHKPFLPMIKDFNQAVHWGKYRHYMGKASISLHKYVNETFLLKTSDSKDLNSSPEDEDAVIEPGLRLEDIDIPEWVSRLPEQDKYQYLNTVYPELHLETVFPQYFTADQINSPEDILKTNILKEWTNGNHLTFYIPAEVQTKLFLPDTSSFRSDQEEYMTDLGEATWEQVLKFFDIDITNVDDRTQYGATLSEVVNYSRNNNYRPSVYKTITDSIDLILAGQNSGELSEQYYNYIIEDFITSNENNLDDPRKEWLRVWSNQDLYQYVDPAPSGGWRYKGNELKDSNGDPMTLSMVKDFFYRITGSSKAAIENLIDEYVAAELRETGVSISREDAEEEVRKAFNVNIYERFFKSGTIQSLMEANRSRAGNITFNEWEVPMIRVDLDPNSVIIDGFYVTLGNNFAKMQVQMQDEPSYQHIGGTDSFVDIKMTVYGEKELMKIKRIFDHISSLSRLEHAAGVIGFLGIKNVVTALSGIKYVMPLNYNVSTKPSFPHVYDVTLRLVDFDIFQQKREELSSGQQKELINHFTTKKNPFLRIKQMWGSFNAYPDFPLQIKDSEGDVVGHLDPDYYFRSFEMFDDDVINNFTTEQPRVQQFIFDQEESEGFVRSAGLVSEAIRNIVNEYNGSNMHDIAAKIAEYVVDHNIDKTLVQRAFKNILEWPDSYFGVDNFSEDRKWELLTEFINYRIDEDNELNPFFEEVVPASYYSVGNLGPSNYSMRQQIENALTGQLSLPDEEYVSFHPDEVDFHKIIYLVPAMSPEDIQNNRASAILITAIGNYFGYLNRDNGRFYLTVSGSNVLIDGTTNGRSLRPNLTKDVGTPDTGISKDDPPFSGVGQSISRYQNAYEGDEYKHWEKMLVDTRYRDISGRMLRVFPTYMLWLIDEGGYFAGIKLFDNFYGLQSVIDFSVVSSEDILGDTLVLRVSNMYSKLTSPQSSEILNPGIDEFNPDQLSLTEGLASIVNRTLNMSRNILGHMRNEYVVDIKNIRLKPGVRVHLRGGYGSNPNSLQTLFNGIITNVEQGEIVTITAQSDAIELGAMVNSTNKKGDSGKIDGGIDTGFWLSEPRDLMVRLLSMGSSRAREAIAYAYGGSIFSENRFGIRHFGTTLYDSMTEQEAWKNQGKMDQMKAAFDSAGKGSYVSGAMNFTRHTTNLVTSMFAANANDIDLEIFKRNIYPGNGTGMAQFLGGDLDDGWSTVSAIVEGDFNERSSEDLATLTDVAWNRLLSESQTGGASANLTLDSLTEDHQLNKSTRGDIVGSILGVGAAAAAGAAATALGPVSGVALAGGGGLFGVLSGRGGSSIFKTMGLISANADDDLPGFDEVSFRAQTYMRTVWDMFEMCARLLPNYIVAVRPFEDRSTIFYGKPHWLYTSGVVPVTTGFKMEEAPAPRRPDHDLLNMLDELNDSTNPLMDMAEFYQSKELNSSVDSLADRLKTVLNGETQDATGQNVNEYAATSKFLNKIINFDDSRGLEYRNESNDVLCKIPQSSGNVSVGFHLPINGVSDISTLRNGVHKQINNLPPRYSFPFFSEITDDGMLKYSSLYDGDYEDTNIQDEFWSAFDELREEEKQFLEETGQTILIDDGVSIELDSRDIDFSPMSSNQNSRIDEFLGGVSSISMPKLSTEYIEEYFRNRDNDEDLLITTNTIQSIYDEWGTPATADDEQFYIAMAWEYDIETSTSYQAAGDVVKENISTYFGMEAASPGGLVEVQDSVETRIALGSGQVQEIDGKYYRMMPAEGGIKGSVSDYKNRKILVYNPRIRRAVVCRPAYRLPVLSAAQSGPTTGSPGQGATVSPDAAYHLGLLSPMPVPGSTRYDSDGNGYADRAHSELCRFYFVPDDTPLGVISGDIAPASILTDSSNPDALVVGFGSFASNMQVESVTMQYNPSTSGLEEIRNTAFDNDFLNWYSIDGGVSMLGEAGSGANPQYLEANQVSETSTATQYTGSSYFQAVRDAQYSLLSMERMIESMQFVNSARGMNMNDRPIFSKVFSPLDSVSVDARNYYDEDFNTEVSVIAGDGRTLLEAQDIWDQFRAGYHNYESVKKIFADVYGMDPDSEVEMPESLRQIITGQSQKVLDKFIDSQNSALDEFAVILGEEWINSSDRNIVMNGGEYDPLTSSLGYGNGAQEAIEFMRQTFIDAPVSQGGLIEGLNNFLVSRLRRVYENFFDNSEVREIFGVQVTTTEEDAGRKYEDFITTPKQLFLLMVGLFRERMWTDPYARAWLVLKPDRKVFNGSTNEKWSFKPVDRVFRAYIDPNNDYAKKKDKFTQLLVATKGEGNSSSNIFSYAANGVGDFFSKTIGPMWSALSDGLSGLLNMYKLSMQQMGYAMDQARDFRKQAHIVNKALNDSIYYSLGRDGSILRAVDNPFTREYGEPVVEVREPFQRIHYISSFSHILSNQIQENINNVATTVTAVSDGKYPVTVALDKGAPAERQVEKTVETGLYFDNMVGEGFFGFLHPLMHPLETIRGVSKNASGSPDELSARRIALSHLKESIKDIYQGELIIIGNGDIRPHDLVYLADVYERMYGLFEVEQVVHHFTSDMGFVTSITPNALVTVNDPSRWYLSSWMHSWLNTQVIRNNARIYLDSIRDGNTGIVVGSNVSIDRLADVLAPEMVGGIQFTHGSSALVKDAIALETAKHLPGSTDAIASTQAATTNASAGAAIGTAAFSIIAGGIAAAAAPVTGGASLAVGAIASNLGGQLAWGGWKWVRDNLLDQHGCYVQYLNRNGQPMDAGLSYNQGMVVGEYHSKSILPGILGVKQKVRSPEGYAYVRTDDLFKSLGWSETSIDSLTRYVSLENALVHARVLGESGISPEKAGLEPMFKVIAKVTHFVDGDTVTVQDVINPLNTFKVRFDGINTSETNVMSGKINYADEVGDPVNTELSLLDLSSAGGRAKIYTYEALRDKVFVLRVNKSREKTIPIAPTATIDIEDYYDAGSEINTEDVYQQDLYERVLGTFFYHIPSGFSDTAKQKVESIFRQVIRDIDSVTSASSYFGEMQSRYPDLSNYSIGLLSEYKKSLGDSMSSETSPVFFNKFNDIYNSIYTSQSLPYYFDYSSANDQLVTETSEQDRRVFNSLVYMSSLESVYATASKWPTVAWDEYYDDGYPVTLNWELVVNNLAKVYVTQLQIESESVNTSDETTPQFLG